MIAATPLKAGLLNPSDGNLTGRNLDFSLN
jgi:hypothetical protein